MDTTAEPSMSKSATKLEPGMTAHGTRKPHPKGYLMPHHQRKVMLGDHHYTPDMQFCTAEWPIPGMQGARTPFKQPPYGAVKISASEMTELARDLHERKDEVCPDDQIRINQSKQFFEQNIKNLPPHQKRIMDYPNYPWNNHPYKPRPETGLSLWPIPGTQGEFTPLRCMWVGGPKALIEYPEKPAPVTDLAASKKFESARDMLNFHSESGMNYVTRPATTIDQSTY